MIQKKDLQKQQRRKRKDPQSRDFKCKCGKSYLSYAAVYTHVKNKHNGDKQFEDSIVKPQIIKQKRGRPRDKKKIVISSETQVLSICQETTLLIYEQLKQLRDRFTHHIVLEGNEEMDRETFDRQYKQWVEKKRVGVNLFECEKQQEKQAKSQDEDNRIFEKFLKGVIKHFSAEIAARTSYVINYLAEVYEDVNFEQRNQIDEYLRELDGMEIWEGRNQVNVIIYEAMLRWLDVIRKEDQAQE